MVGLGMCYISHAIYGKATCSCLGSTTILHTAEELAIVAGDKSCPCATEVVCEGLRSVPCYTGRASVLLVVYQQQRSCFQLRHSVSPL
jgi:hypothetical protein